MLTVRSVNVKIADDLLQKRTDPGINRILTYGDFR